MPGLILLLIPIALALALPLTLIARALGHRLNAMDAQGVQGQIKAAARRIPNTGGIAIFWAFALPLIVGLIVINSSALSQHLIGLLPGVTEHLRGLRAATPSAIVLLVALGALHAMGLVDDRRPLPAHPKLLAMLLIAGLFAWLTDTRLLTAVDPLVGGKWLSVLITILWIVVITNAFNFLDNMDGLSPGVAAICAACLLAVALTSPMPQWFIGACLALLLGALLGFLRFNFPFRTRLDTTGAAPREVSSTSIFQGDAGSLVVGFLLAILSVRITYAVPTSFLPGPRASGAELLPALFTPLVILAIPIYDFVSVTIIRLRQGKSPFVGDLQHFSHRLVRHGLSRRAAVVVIYGCTAVTAIGGLSLTSLRPWQAALVIVQTGLVLMVLALYEWARTPVGPTVPLTAASMDQTP